MRPSWKVRRRLCIAGLLFCGLSIIYLMVLGTDTKLNETIALGLFGLGVSIYGAYVFGATWDDRNVMSLLGKDAYQDEAPPPPPSSYDGLVG